MQKKHSKFIIINTIKDLKLSNLKGFIPIGKFFIFLGTIFLFLENFPFFCGKIFYFFGRIFNGKIFFLFWERFLKYMPFKLYITLHFYLSRLPLKAKTFSPMIT